MATVKIIERATGTAIETTDATNMRDATQIASAIRINLDHENYYVKVED